MEITENFVIFAAPRPWKTTDAQIREAVICVLDRSFDEANAASRAAAANARHRQADRQKDVAHAIGAAIDVLVDDDGVCWKGVERELREYVLSTLLRQAIDLTRCAQNARKLGLEAHAARLQLGRDAFHAAAELLGWGAADVAVAG